MPIPLKAREVLDREFLEIRAKLVQLAAHFDRIERGTGDVVDDARIQKIHLALEVLSHLGIGPTRAEKLQMIFSREYDAEWRDHLGVSVGASTAGNIQRVPGR